ncbi:hypothetical protein GGF32_005400 [Allomyces javanicus]|nr:hypothetical protein GGF32_005400 [Allomyces javanicus]
MANDAEPLTHGVVIDERGHQVLRGYNTKQDVPKSVRDSLKLDTYKRTRVCLLCKLEGVKGGGTSVCDPHSKQNYGCKCCTHDRQVQGYATRYCYHLFKRHECGSCKGRKICTTVGCHLRAWEKGGGLCMICFLDANPGHVLAKAHRAKEVDVVAHVRRLCPDLPFLYNKCIPTGTARRRPDISLDLGSFVLVLEIDEDQHRGSAYVDEHARIQDLQADANGRPLVVIRFNPDRFLDAAGNVVESCWARSASGLTCVVDEIIWLERLAVLVASSRHAIQTGKPKYAITVLKLYYNRFSSADPYQDTSSLTAREVNNEYEIDEVALDSVNDES